MSNDEYQNLTKFCREAFGVCMRLKMGEKTKTKNPEDIKKFNLLSKIIHAYYRILNDPSVCIDTLEAPIDDPIYEPSTNKTSNNVSTTKTNNANNDSDEFGTSYLFGDDTSSYKTTYAFPRPPTPPTPYDPDFEKSSMEIFEANTNFTQSEKFKDEFDNAQKYAQMCLQRAISHKPYIVEDDMSDNSSIGSSNKSSDESSSGTGLTEYLSSMSFDSDDDDKKTESNTESKIESKNVVQIPYDSYYQPLSIPHASSVSSIPPPPPPYVAYNDFNKIPNYAFGY